MEKGSKKISIEPSLIAIGAMKIIHPFSPASCPSAQQIHAHNFAMDVYTNVTPLPPQKNDKFCSFIII
jgi:hypothetical protein